MKIVIYGANETGSMLATEFFEDHDIFVIDPDFKKLENFSRLDIASICGEATNVNVLKEVGIKDADVFIACNMLDEANIASCFMVKQFSEAKTVCFVSRKENQDSLRAIRECVEKDNSIYIDHVIWPEKLLTQEFFRIVTVPEAIDVENFAHGRARLFEYRIKENSILAGKKLKDCNFPKECLVVGIVRDDELSIPLGDSEFQIGDKAIFMGTPEGLDICASKFFIENDTVKKVTIIGGGSVGFELAKSLELTPIRAKIIEKDYVRCEFLSENLKNALVLHADGTNRDLLNQENIADSDVTVSVTDNDEKNLLCSLLMKQLGVKKVVSRVAQSVTASLFEEVGIDIAISPREAAVNEINNRIVESQAGIIATVERGLGEIIEVCIPPDFKDVALMNLKLPTRAVIAIIQRQNHIIIPNGQTLIRSSDKLIIFVKAQDAFKVKEFFNKCD